MKDRVVVHVSIINVLHVVQSCEISFRVTSGVTEDSRNVYQLPSKLKLEDCTSRRVEVYSLPK